MAGRGAGEKGRKGPGHKTAGVFARLALIAALGGLVGYGGLTLFSLRTSDLDDVKLALCILAPTAAAERIHWRSGKTLSPG